MAQQISKPTTLPAQRDTFPKLNRFFDCGELIAERTEALLSKSKPAAISMFLFAHLIIDLIVVLVVLLRRSG